MEAIRSEFSRDVITTEYTTMPRRCHDVSGLFRLTGRAQGTRQWSLLTTDYRSCARYEFARRLILNREVFFSDCLCFPLPADLSSLAMGRPGPLRPAADVHEQICQLVWHHAPGPFPDETGPRSVQGPGVNTAQKIQRYRATLTTARPFFWAGKGAAGR